MATDNEPGTLPHHLDHLAADADDVAAMLQRHHDEGGDIHPEALGKSAALATSLREVLHAFGHHEHLAMKPDDIWKVLTVKHTESDGETLT